MQFVCCYRNTQPTPAPPRYTMAKCSDSLMRLEIPSPLPLLVLTPSTTARIDENTIKPVASLKLASNSINVERPFGTLNFLKFYHYSVDPLGKLAAAKRNETAKFSPATSLADAGHKCGHDYSYRCQQQG